MTVGILMPEEDPDDNDPFSDIDSLIGVKQTEIESESAQAIYLDKGIAGFTDYVLNRNTYQTKQAFGDNPAGSVLLSFFEDPDNEKMLSEIRKKNEKDKSGRRFIEGTHIELLNFSCCPSCRRIYSFNELIFYYNNPVRNEKFRSRMDQLRNETAVCCSDCGTYFVPSLIIIHKEPKHEIQFLCRMQTIQAVERFFFGKFGNRVLSRKSKNRIEKDGKKYILNDVLLSQLAERPALILNLLQYSPANLQQNMIAGENVKRADILFGALLYFPE